MNIQDTERELCGAALDDPRITASITLSEPQFDNPQYGLIWEGIRALHAKDIRPTPTLIVDEVARQGLVDHATIVDLVGVGFAGNADHYATLIADAHRRRGIKDTIRRAQQLLEQDMPTDEIVAGLTSRLDVVTEAEQDAEGLLTIDEFVDQELPPEEWIIPGLFAAGERAILTGDEGAGKSMLLRQIALCAAVGVHPFTYARFRPARVLIVDAENPKPIMVRKFRSIRDSLRDGYHSSADDRCWVRRYPQGMDLSQSRDRMALHNLCMMTRPDLLVIGPAYKLYIGGSNTREEDLARQVTSVLDGLREEFGFGLLLEHHTPHENNTSGKRFPRPIGSSLWRRWPEYGFGLTLTSNDPRHRIVEVKHWRGQREDRPWPSELESGGRLPWAVVDAMEAAELRSVS